MEMSTTIKSLGTPPEQVLSNKAVMESLKGVPMDYVTGPFGDQANNYEIPLGIAFKNHSNHLDLTRIGIDYVVKDDVAYLRTSNNVFGFPIKDLQMNGTGINRDDFYIEGWIAATERPDGSLGNGGIEYVESPEFVRLIVARHEHQPDPVMRKFVTEVVDYHGPINEFGKHLSETENTRQAWDMYEESPEELSLAEQKGHAEEVEYVGEVSIPGVIYGVGKFKEKIVLSGTDRTYEMLSEEADLIGVSVEDRRIAALGEEKIHIYRGVEPSPTIEHLIEEERATKQELLEHYRALAEGAGSDSKLRETYSKIARLIEFDIDTVEIRYGNVGEQIAHRHEKSNLEHVLMAEAYANGCKTDEQVSAYVARKMAEIDKEDNESSLENIAEDVKDSNLKDTSDTEDTELSDYEADLGSEESGAEAPDGDSTDGDSGDGADGGE